MFKHDYLEFDQFGVKTVKCMSCDKAIKTRSEIMSAHYPDRIIRELSKHADYREIPVILEDGKLAFIMVCDGCKFIPITDEIAKDISNQLQRALMHQLIEEGKESDVVLEIVKSRNFTVLRKAEVSEVTSALRGIK